jgi:hypothetical protein
VIEVFTNADRTEFLVHTTCTTPEDFLVELATVLTKLPKDEGIFLGVIQNAMKVAYKLSGYKAEEVRESRSLTCGHVMPGQKNVLATS